ncbi:MAG: aminoacetone oxidase family FAD-binding enzyme [Heliobacteriaceae bacterium]|jgi:predicted Rossmann fold flavoprotein|nr:aminoacetone oxidase family FAD-binding enzyme [Heliobacteriaceae bacterium]
MVPELNKPAVIGAGPAGCMAAYYLQNVFGVTLFDPSEPLKTLLATGGGRCNLAYAQYDFKELAKFYPRGEKFLYSVFSKFAAADTLEFFKQLGVETYTQPDNRIFPVSNSAKDVREKFLNALKKCRFVKEKVLGINVLNEGFEVVTDKKNYSFDKIVIASGGHSSYDIVRSLGHTVVEPKPALTGLKTKENFKALAGVSIQVNGENLLFTHGGISGPLAYKISSINARADFPYRISLDFVGEVDLQAMLNDNPHKSLKNLLSELVPKSLAVYILGGLSDEKCHKTDGKTRDEILRRLRNFEITVTGASKGGEVVTCGGVALSEVNPKTLESKLVKGICFCGEVLDIDGFCGGFNLQNCWSTGFTAADYLSGMYRNKS